jgi:hypothetical protein
MREEETVAKALAAWVAPAPQEERRRSLRNRRPKPVRVRPSDLQYNEEVWTTLNASRDGLYFATWSKHYYVGMPLLITFLFAYVDTAGAEHSAEVVRIDRLGHSRLGIAVRLLLR